MNERINELFEQALKEFNEENKYATIIVPNPLKEKFAELIVRECIGKIENEAAQYAEPVWAFELVNDIKEHFGVEE